MHQPEWTHGYLQVVCGELGESVLEQLSSLSQEVVLPLLSNPANHVGISDGVGREVQDRLHQFIADGVALAQLNTIFSEHPHCNTQPWRISKPCAHGPIPAAYLISIEFILDSMSGNDMFAYCCWLCALLYNMHIHA